MTLPAIPHYLNGHVNFDVSYDDDVRVAASTHACLLTIPPEPKRYVEESTSDLSIIGVEPLHIARARRRPLADIPSHMHLRSSAVLKTLCAGTSRPVFTVFWYFLAALCGRMLHFCSITLPECKERKSAFHDGRESRDIPTQTRNGAVEQRGTGKRHTGKECSEDEISLRESRSEKQSGEVVKTREFCIAIKPTFRWSPSDGTLVRGCGSRPSVRLHRQ